MLVKVLRQFADFVFPLDIDFVFQISRGSDLLGDLHEIGQRLGNGLRGRMAIATPRPSAVSVLSSAMPMVAVAGRIIRLNRRSSSTACFPGRPGRDIQLNSSPRNAASFCRVEDLQFGHGRVPLVHFLPLLHQRLGKVPVPVLFGLLYFGQRGSLLLGGGQR